MKKKGTSIDNFFCIICPNSQVICPIRFSQYKYGNNYGQLLYHLPEFSSYCPTRFFPYKYGYVKEHNRSFRQIVARQLTNGCTFDSVLKTCVRSGFASSWIGRFYGGITWNAVHSMDDSICVVIRHGDLDMTSLGWFHEASEFEGVIYNLTKAIVSEVEGLPYDDDFRERSGQSIKKTFGVVSVFPVTKKSDEETGQLASSVEYGKDKAINFLMEKMKSESVITLDDAVKTAISAFKHLWLEELEAEEYWVTARDRH